jgi:hypothetical protein
VVGDMGEVVDATACGCSILSCSTSTTDIGKYKIVSRQ